MRRITLEEALKLVDFTFDEEKGWQVENVKGDVTCTVEGHVDIVKGNVGSVCGNVQDVFGNVATAWCNVGEIRGAVRGDVRLSVWGNVEGDVGGTINNREWQFVKTSEEKLKRLIEETENSELIELFNQMENN